MSQDLHFQTKENLYQKFSNKENAPSTNKPIDRPVRIYI
jgi:hypothetical protein